MPELLLEILSEEIPARMQARAAEDLKRLVVEGLKQAGLEFGAAEAYATPRRLALVVEDLPDRQPDVRDERRGPRADAPAKALDGFLNSVGLTSVDQCEQRETPKGTFLFVVVEKRGEATAEVLSGIILAAVNRFPWPKAMRWGHSTTTWVRPPHGILAVFGGKPLAGALSVGGGEAAADIAFGAETQGHRFLAPDAFAVDGFADYRAKLRDAHVMLDPAERRLSIETQLAALAEAEGLRIKPDAGLLDEVTGLVEWPTAMLGTIEQDFMALPPEVLTTAMRTHQKYFSLEDDAGNLAPRFGLVANNDRAAAQGNIVAGNERVLRARLSDARFFWDQDRARSLADYATQLSQVTFHAKLGTLDQKVDRVEALAGALAGFVPGADRDRVRSAARLAKADLVTGMVGEFPELQGIMGRYYAIHDGEHEDVADAIADHYSPLGPGDACPTKPVSAAVALADKIDTLVGFWSIAEKPTGSRDPYALRRAALGVIRLVLENGLRLPLRQAFAAACRNYGALSGSFDADDLMGFFADRLKVHLREQGVRHDLIQAVFALGGEDDLVRLMARVEALRAFLASEDGANLLTAYKRAANIVAIETKKDMAGFGEAPRPELMELEEESALFAYLDEATEGAEQAIAEERYDLAMRAMAQLRAPIDSFFDRVTVNAEDRDLRRNRLCLLSQFGATLDKIADFGQIEGQGAA